jgi:hypothetical protein
MNATDLVDSIRATLFWQVQLSKRSLYYSRDQPSQWISIRVNVAEEYNKRGMKVLQRFPFGLNDIGSFSRKSNMEQVQEPVRRLQGCMWKQSE